MTTKPFILAGFVMLFISVSCNSDDAPASPAIPNNDNVAFDHYTIEKKVLLDDGTQQTKQFTTANLLDQKFYSETTEDFIGNAGQGQSTIQHYFYENGLLAKREYDGDKRTFFYDAEGRLVAIDWLLGNEQYYYYRFVHVSASKVYFERLTLPYNDLATTVFSRYILEFDANDNIVKIGRDANLDGTSLSPNTFDYDAANNLIAIHKPDGTVNVAYSVVKDNFAQLAINTYGKKNWMVYQAECFALAQLDGLRQSPNLRDADTQEALIETQGLPFYYRKTQLVENTKVITTFYFE